MGLLALLNKCPLPANTYSLKATGLIEMGIDADTKQPYWVMNAYGSCTAGSWYSIDWVAGVPTIGTLTTGIHAIVGLATETVTTEWTKLYVAGYVSDVASSSTIAAGAGCEVLSAGVTVVIDDGADIPLIVSNTIAQAQTAASGNLVDLWILGREVNVAGS